MLFVNSTNKLFSEVSQNGKPPRPIFFTMKVGLQRGFLNRLNKFFPTKYWRINTNSFYSRRNENFSNENFQRLDKVSLLYQEKLRYTNHLLYHILTILMLFTTNSSIPLFIKNSNLSNTTLL